MTPNPGKAGFSAPRLNRIDDFLRRTYIDKGVFPGVLTLVSRRGELAYLGLSGQMDRERGRPMAEDTIFRIYSMTKPITSLAMMMLVERGLVGLDAPVHAFIPEWRGQGVFKSGGPGAFRTSPTARPMQIVDLMRHTSGLTYGLQNRTNVDAAYRAAGLDETTPKVTLKGLVEAAGAIPLEFSPGTAWNYSVSTDVLGWLVQVISGQSFESFLQDHIFGPLGMTDTGFHVPAGKADRLAACYILNEKGGMDLFDDPGKSPFLAPPLLVSGGGGLVSTAADYAKFCQMILRGGAAENGERLVGRKTLELMGANHLPGGADLPALSVSMFSEAAYSGVGFGLGFAVTLDPARTLLPGSAGDLFWGGMAGTYFWVDPAEDMFAIFLTQMIPSTAFPVRRQLRTLVYAALE